MVDATARKSNCFYGVSRGNAMQLRLRRTLQPQCRGQHFLGVSQPGG